MSTFYLAFLAMWVRKAILLSSYSKARRVPLHLDILPENTTSLEWCKMMLMKTLCKTNCLKISPKKSIRYREFNMKAEAPTTASELTAPYGPIR